MSSVQRDDEDTVCLIEYDRPDPPPVSYEMPSGTVRCLGTYSDTSTSEAVLANFRRLVRRRLDGDKGWLVGATIMQYVPRTGSWCAARVKEWLRDDVYRVESMLADGTKREDVIGLRRRIWRLQEELHLRDGVDHIVVDLCSDLMRSYGAEDAQAQARNEGLHLAFCKDSPTGYECVEVSSGSTDVRHIAVARFANEFDCMDDPPTRICAFQSAHVAAICAARARREWESMIENAGYQAANIITRERNRGEQCAVRADEDGNQPQQQTMVAAEKSDESPSSQDGLRRAATMSPVTQITQRSSGSKRCGSCGGCDLFKMSGCGHCVNCKGKEAGGMQKWGCLRALCHGSNAYAKSQNAKCRAMERQTSLSDVGLLDPNDYVVQVGQKLQCFSYLDHKTKWWTCELRSYSVTDGVYTLVDLASGSELRVEPADVLFASLSHAPLPSPRHKWSSRSKDVQRIASRTGDAQGIESQVASSSEDADVTLEPDTISKICATNGLKEAAERFKVQWKRAGNTTWVSARKIPHDLLQPFIMQRQAEANFRVEPRLRDEASTGVVACNVDPAHATSCANHLQQWWRNGRLPLKGGKVAYGYAEYGKVLAKHDREQQRTHTLLVTHALLPRVRAEVAGFFDMEKYLIGWLHERFGTVVELFYAHCLRQGPETLKSTGFSVHQDNEEFEDIKYTVVVKLTPDGPGEPPSQMRVLGADEYFDYGAEPGAAGCFLAELFHASVAPRVGARECLKIAYFFKASVMGERRAKRGRPLREEWENSTVAERRHQVALELNQACDEDGNGERVVQARRWRCKSCQACLRPDCGKCVACKDMRKFGGKGTKAKACESRACEAPVYKRERWQEDAGAQDARECV